MNLRGRVVEALLLLVAIAVAGRVVWGLLGPLLPTLLLVIVLGSLLLWVVRGPHARR